MLDNTRQPAATTEEACVAADTLFRKVVEIVSGAQERVAQVVNSTMVQTYWEIGRQIVLVEQKGGRRADYGEQILLHLSERLTRHFGRGYGVKHLARIRQFYQTYPAPDQGKASSVEIDSQEIVATPWRQLPPAPQPALKLELGWSHYRLLMVIEDPTVRTFYEHEAANQGWSVRELERQIASHLHERLAVSRDNDQVLALSRRGQQVLTPQDVIKDPVVLEFLGLPERPHWRERDLEQAIIDHLQEFMLELGKGFCFIARQRRITIGGDHFFVDLVLYNRLLRCFVVIDLKLGKLTHRDLGQVQMYVNWFDRTQREPHEEPTIGIALCSRKNDAMVRMTLPEGEGRILAARYDLVMPTTEQLAAAVRDGRRAAERGE